MEWLETVIPSIEIPENLWKSHIRNGFHPQIRGGGAGRHGSSRSTLGSGTNPPPVTDFGKPDDFDADN